MQYDDLNDVQKDEYDELDKEIELTIEDVESEYGSYTDDMLHDIADSITAGADPDVRAAIMRGY